MSVEWKPGMVDTLGRVVGYVGHAGRAYARGEDGDVYAVWDGDRRAAELDFAHPSNTGHILAHVHEQRPGVAVSLYYHPDAGAGWCGEIDDWHTYGTLPDVLRAMVGRVSDV